MEKDKDIGSCWGGSAALQGERGRAGPDDRTPSDPFGDRYPVTPFLEDALGCPVSLARTPARAVSRCKSQAGE